jgi:3D (Asp-Asp-Asp) domain-containing protein
MRSVVVVSLALTALSLTACANEEQQQAAVDVALAKVGDCLNIAGYDVRPERLQEDAGPGIQGADAGLIFHSEQGAKPIRIQVTIDSKKIVALDGGDLKRLQEAGCNP